jgi:folylpolyglutamate synthase/dihydropteroate synthase
MLTQLPRDWPAVFTAVHETRALPPGRLLERARELGRDGDEVVEGAAVALKRARARAGSEGTVLVIGSLYLAGEARDALGL